MPSLSGAKFLDYTCECRKVREIVNVITVSICMEIIVYNVLLTWIMLVNIGKVRP